MTEAMKKFFQYLEFERNYSANTVEAYRSDLEQFHAFVLLLLKTNQKIDLHSLDKTHIRLWLSSLNRENVKLISELSDLLIIQVAPTSKR